MERKYTARDVVRLARRLGNNKRTELLVNPLQAKHMPVSPGAALAMMRAVAGAARQELAGKALLTIGFAETATAIATVVARELGSPLLTTTRERVPGVTAYFSFLEEHSHATDQRICAEGLLRLSRGIDALLLVDDEISTGNTVCNIVAELRAKVPALAETPCYVLSVLNRMDGAGLRRFESLGIEARWLVKWDPDITEAWTGELPAGEIGSCAGGAEDAPLPVERIAGGALDPRLGIAEIGAYIRACDALAARVLEALRDECPRARRVLVLGTEECMYPALHAGRLLEESLPGAEIRCHATTRSPITPAPGLPGYPIESGVRMRSFYDEGRETYLYNLRPYDAAVVVTDAWETPGAGLADLACALRRAGTTRLPALRWVP